MSGDARNFNNIEMRAVIKFFFLQGMAPKEFHAILTETLWEHAPSYATIKNWVAQFKHGDFSTCDGPRPGTVTTLEIIDQIHELILEDHWISAKSTWIKNVNVASRLSNFWNFFGVIQMISCRAWLVTMDET